MRKEGETKNKKEKKKSEGGRVERAKGASIDREGGGGSSGGDKGGLLSPGPG